MKSLYLIIISFMIFSIVKAQSISETLAQIESLKKEYADLETLMQQEISELQKTNPLFASKSPFETDSEYFARFIRTSPLLEKLDDKYLHDIRSNLRNLRSRSFETDSIEVTFGDYHPEKQLWDIGVKHTGFQREEFNIKVSLDQSNAKAIHDNKDRLIIKGILSIDPGDIIGLARLSIKEPLSGYEIMYEFPLKTMPREIKSFSHDSKYVIMNYNVCYDLETGIIDDWRGKTEGEIEIIRSAGNCLITFCPDNPGTGEDEEKVRFYRCSDFEKVYEYTPSYRSQGKMSMDYRYLVTTVSVIVYDLLNQKEFYAVDDWFTLIAFNLAEDAIAILDYYDEKRFYIKIINLETKKRISRSKLTGKIPREEFDRFISFSPNGLYLVFGPVQIDRKDSKGLKGILEWNIEQTTQKGIFIWDIKNKRISSYFDNVRHAGFSPIGNYIALSGTEKTEIIDLKTDKQHSLINATGKVEFSPDGRFLAVGESIYRTHLSELGTTPEQIVFKPPQLTTKMSFEEPSGNKFLDALETGSVELTLTNTGQGSANRLSIRLTPNKTSGLAYSDAFISEIPAGKTVSVDIPIEAYMDVKDGTHTLQISFEEANGFSPAPMELTFSTRAYKKPELVIYEVGIDDSNKNGKIEAGEMIKLTVRFSNRGAGPANATYAKFYVGENAFITEKHAKMQSLGDLAPSETRDLELEIFINESCANEIPLYVDIKEATGLAGVSKLRVPILKSDHIRPVTSLVVTGTDIVYDIKEPSSLNIDVEIDLPQAQQVHQEDYAVIFGVENHSGNVPRVLYATRDAAWFREYALQTLGIPVENIYYRVNADATKNEFDKVFGRNGWLEKRAHENSRVYFFFSGHGIPSTKGLSAYILPYDGDPNYVELTAYPLENAYAGLTGLKSSLNVVFLDACFTGVNRENQALYATARPVFISPNRLEAPPQVSLFSAAAWNQMSNAWPEKQHGLFSYFLLKGMQGAADANSDRKLTLGEMHEYLSREVPVQAARLDKEQVPQLSSSMHDTILIEYQ